jgi:Raf kinase inhibitor-like YbhB/YbcL family protein
VKPSKEGVVLEKLPVQLGDVLRSHRAGIDGTAYHRLLAARTVSRMQIVSPAFAMGQSIPTRYTADGPGISPPIHWSDAPEDADSLVLMVEDADSPTPHPLVHAIAINLDPARGSLLEGALNVDEDEHLTHVALGVNSLLMRGWLPPDPPPGHGEHRYVFQIFALASGAALPNAAGRHQVFEAISERALAAGCLLGTYERPRRIEIDEAERDGLSGLAAAAVAPAAT